jgi:hypothetical protein
MNSIFNYFDFREYLKDDLARRKAGNPAFSIRSMAVRLKVDSSTLVRIFNKQRNISPNLLPKLIKFLGLRSKESEYFIHLVKFCQAKSERDYAFYEEWYYSAVRELLRFYPFTGDYQALSRMLEPVITVHEARRAIDLLLRCNFIKRSGDAYAVCDSTITTGEQWHGPAIQRFHRDTLVKTIEGLDRIPRQERDFSTMTMCYSPEGYKKVRELLRRTREEMTRIEEADRQRNRVYQINMQLFPLSKSYGEKE